MHLGVTFVRLTPVLSTWRQSLKAEKKRSGKLDFVWRDATSPVTSCKYQRLPTVERDGEVWRGVMEILVQFLFVSRLFVWRCWCLSRSRSVAWQRECRPGNVDLNCFFKFQELFLQFNFFSKECTAVELRTLLKFVKNSCFVAFFSSQLFCKYSISFLQSSARSCRRKPRRRCTFARWNRLWKHTKIVF